MAPGADPRQISFLGADGMDDAECVVSAKHVVSTKSIYSRKCVYFKGNFEGDFEGYHERVNGKLGEDRSRGG